MFSKDAERGSCFPKMSPSHSAAEGTTNWRTGTITVLALNIGLDVVLIPFT